MKVFAQTDIGRVRPINEDSYYLPAEDERFCAVADGMGGHNAGEVASAMAVRVFSEEMRKESLFMGKAMHRAVDQANAAIYEHAQKTQGCSGMGTTFTALLQHDAHVHIAHVGDSRAYLIRGNSVQRVTTDHTLVAEMVQKGIITEHEAKYHPKRNYITRALGTTPHVQVDMLKMDVFPGDVFLLCSDGLSNHVGEQCILEITRSEADWTEKLRKLIDMAMQNGGTDNITAVYAVFEEDAE